jgi:hypothetical protein
VGLGGVGATSSLAQAGIAAGCSNGRPGYDAWAEWYDPHKKNPEIVQKGFKVIPGDELNITIRESNSSRYIASLLEWNPANGSQSGAVAVPLTDPGGRSLGNSAECVVERPVIAGVGYQPVSAFGTVTISPCEASTEPNIDSYPHTVVDVVDGVQYNIPTSSTMTPTGTFLEAEKLNLVVTGHLVARTTSTRDSTDPLFWAMSVTKIASGIKALSCPSSARVLAAWNKSHGVNTTNSKVTGFSSPGCWKNWVVASPIAMPQGNGYFYFDQTPSLHSDSARELQDFYREVCATPSAPEFLKDSPC